MWRRKSRKFDTRVSHMKQVKFQLCTTKQMWREGKRGGTETAVARREGRGTYYFVVIVMCRLLLQTKDDCNKLCCPHPTQPTRPQSFIDLKIDDNKYHHHHHYHHFLPLYQIRHNFESGASNRPVMAILALSAPCLALP